MTVVTPAPVDGLLTGLAVPAADGYRRRRKSSRDYPRKKRSHPRTPPRVHPLKRLHIAQLKAQPR